MEFFNIRELGEQFGVTENVLGKFRVHFHLKLRIKQI